MNIRPSHIITCAFVFLFLTGIVASAQDKPDRPHQPHQGGAGQGHAGKRPAGQHAQHSAPADPHLSVKAIVDKKQILIGQPIQLMLEVTVPPEVSNMTWPELDSLPHFEWVEKGGIDSVFHPDEHLFRQHLIVTSFDSGAWSIPRLPFTVGGKIYFSDSVRIEVGYTKIDPNQDYHDIKDIIDIPNSFAKWIGWIIALVALSSLALVIWLVRKKKKANLSGPVAATLLSPYEEAIKGLEELERQKLSENGTVKIYYTRLNDILRLFVLRKLGITSLVETNEELIGELRQLPITPEQFSELAETLRMSDFVKFAKYQPGIADNERNWRVIRSSVELLNTIEK